MGPRSHERDNRQTKKMILLRKFSCNTDFGCMISERILEQQTG